jgi:hypothetical protein
MHGEVAREVSVAIERRARGHFIARVNRLPTFGALDSTKARSHTRSFGTSTRGAREALHALNSGYF